MTTTASPNVAVRPVRRPALLRAAAVTAVLGPAFYAAGVLSHPPEHLDRAAQLAEVAASPGRWTVAHLLVAAAAVVLLPALLGLAAIIPQRAAAMFAAVAAFVGLPALYGIVALELVLLEMAAGSADRSEMVALGDRIFESLAVTGALFVPSTLWTLGLVVLAVSAGRARLLPWWVVGLLVVASLAAAVPGGAFRTVGAVLLLLGMLPVAAKLNSAARADEAS